MGVFLIYVLLFRYLPAMLSAKEGKITKTVAMRSFISTTFTSELLPPLPGEVRTNNIPKIPKMTEAVMNVRVAIFCIVLV